MSSIRWVLGALLAFGATAWVGAARADNFVVNDPGSDADEDPGMGDNLCLTAGGVCTLRAAIEEANEITGPHTITFDSSVMAINLTADIPDIRVRLTIDGTNASAVGGRVDINGGAVMGTGGVDCFDLISTGTVMGGINNPNGGQGSNISNLVIRNCADDGITASGHGYTFQNNYIGVNPAGTMAAENDGDGIRLSGTIPPPAIPPDISSVIDDPASNFAEIVAFAASLETALTVIAQPNDIVGNLISGNDQSAIELNNGMTTNTFVVGNIIGLNHNATAAIPNGTGGGAPAAVELNAGAYGNFVGPGNIISGNTNVGLHLTGAVILPNFVAGNLIGIGSAPALELGNGEQGIDTDATLDTDGTAPDNPTGYTLFLGPANVISDNNADDGSIDTPLSDTSGGVLVSGQGVRIFGNAVGLFAFPAGAAFGPLDQLVDVGNTGNGIVLTTSGHQVGGSEVFEANFILKNGRHGIIVRGSGTTGNLIQGNFIGVAPPTGLDVFNLGNAGNGIIVHSASSTKIGGTGDFEDNVIAGNGRNGVALRGGASNTGWSHLIQRNQIYRNGNAVMGEGIAIDLEGDCFQIPENDCNDPDFFPDPAGPDPNDTYANKGQNRPIVCTGLDTPVPGCAAPAYNAGSGATTASWTITTRPSTTLRIEHFALRPDGMSFLYDETVTTDAAGIPISGTMSSCAAGICTSTGTPASATDTRGQSVVMTATDLFPTDVPPVGMGAMNDPANNTSEYSEGAAIPQEIAFSAATYSAGEAAGTTQITLRRLGDPNGAVSIDVLLAGAPGSATGGGVDYTLVTPNPITWADGDAADKTFTVAIADDTLDENDETVNLELANPVGAIEGTPNATTLTITDNDAPPTIAIADNGLTESDASQPLQFTATLSAASSFDVVITYTTANGSATAPADYTAAMAQQVTILAGATQASFNIDVAGDLLDEDVETFLVDISATNTTAAGSDLQATGTITDNDPLPVLSIDDVGPTPEGNGPGTTPFTFTVSLAPASGRPVTVRVTSGAGGDTASAPADYGTINQLVVIPAGMTSAQVTVDVVGDTTFEAGATETFTLTLAADAVQPLNATIGDPTGIGTITNDDASPGTLQFTPLTPDQSVAENVGTATFNVSRSGGSAGAVSTTVTLGGTATEGAGNDYTTTSLVLNWTDGDTANKTITVTVNDDVGQEADETVTFTLGAPSGGATLGAPVAATLTILANDAPAGSLQFTPVTPDQSVAENVGSATFNVSRTGGSAGAVSTTVTLGGTAAEGAGNDYTTTSLVLNWADGDAANKTITVTVNDDVAPEAAETVTLTLGAPSGGATLGAPAAATLTIQASDAAAGMLQFTPLTPDQTVAENVGTATFTVSRSGGSSGAVSTTVTLGGTATEGAGNDYTTSSLTLSWADGDTADKTITVTVNDDVAPEAAETVTLTLGAPSGGATLGAPAAATLTIQASDAAAGTLQFTPVTPDQTVAENVGTATFNVSRTGGSAGAVSTTVTLGGTATEGVGNDYTTTSLLLSWADGDAANKTITVTVNDDVAPEAAETVTMTLGTPSGGATLGAPAAATLTIQASDAAAGTLQFTPVTPDQSVAENVGAATFTVSRTGGSAGAVSTTVALGGSATQGVGNDYTTSSLTLTWADGDSANKTITITVNDDVAPEGAETVTLTLGAPSGGATLGAPATATLTIQANDAAAGTLQFTPATPDQSVAENVGTATFTVSRTGGSAGLVSTTVTLGGSATLGVGNDYTTTSLVLSWADGDSANKTITVTVNDDATPEAAETVTLTLGVPSGGATLGAPASATLTIQASDTAAGTIAFAGLGANQTVGENVGTVTYTFSRSGGSSGAVSVTVTLGGSAANPADYSNSSTTISWADGDTTDKTLTFTIVDDPTIEPTETVTLAVGAPTGGAVVGAPGNGTLSILDNDGAVGQTQAVVVPVSSRWTLALLALLLCLGVARSLPGSSRD